MLCPKCKKENMQYFPWLGQIWKCNCGYIGPIALELTSRALLEFLRKIPKGKVVTYKSLAKKFDIRPRAVAKILANNKNTIRYPCYKVVRSDGCVGGYSGRGKMRGKISLLRKDGIEVRGGKIDLKKYEWTDFLNKKIL